VQLRKALCNYRAMGELERIKVSGDLEGEYVVLAHHSGNVLRIAPLPPSGLPALTSLKKTCSACPSQWEGELEDGRALYARYRGGLLRVGIGEDVDDAHTNSFPKAALYCEHVGDGLDGWMTFEELKGHLLGLLEFPSGLEAETEHEPSWDFEGFKKIFGARKSANPNPAQEGETSGGNT
jgi:hypothetical protein